MTKKNEGRRGTGQKKGEKRGKGEVVITGCEIICG